MSLPAPTRPVGHPAATEICRGVLLGGIWDAHDRRLVQHHHVSHLLVLSTSKWAEPVAAMCRTDEHLSVVAADIGTGMVDLREALADGLPFLQLAVRAGGVVLVACGDEVGCSGCGPSLVAAHIALDGGMILPDAIRHMQQARPFALMDPELSVVKQLCEWDTVRSNSTSLDALKDALGIASIPVPSFTNTTTHEPVELSDEVPPPPCRWYKLTSVFCDTGDQAQELHCRECPHAALP